MIVHNCDNNECKAFRIADVEIMKCKAGHTHLEVKEPQEGWFHYITADGTILDACSIECSVVICENNGIPWEIDETRH